MILPFTVLRRLDCVLEPTKAAVLAEQAAKKKLKLSAEPSLLRKAKQSFYNTRKHSEKRPSALAISSNTSDGRQSALLGVS